MHLSQQQAGLCSVDALCRFCFQGRKREMESVQSELLHSKKSATEKWSVTNVACSFLQSPYTVNTVLFISVALLKSKARKATEVKLSYVETFQSNHVIKAISDRVTLSK